MNIGPGLFLVSLGAVMAFAVNYPTERVDVQVVGWILMAAGAVLIRLDLLEFVPRRRVTLAEPIDEPAAAEPAAQAPTAQAPTAPAPAPQTPQAPPAPSPAPPATAPVPAPRQSGAPAPGPSGSGTPAGHGQAAVQWPEGVRRA